MFHSIKPFWNRDIETMLVMERLCDYNKQKLLCLLEKLTQRFNTLKAIQEEYTLNLNRNEHPPQSQIFKDTSPIICIIRNNDDTFFRNTKFEIIEIFKGLPNSIKMKLRGHLISIPYSDQQGEMEKYECDSCNCESCKSK